MAFTPNCKKLPNSGRKKGTPNKKTAEFKEILGDFKTVLEMKKLFFETEKEELKLAICKEFLKYEYPQRKAVDMDLNAESYTVYINHEAVAVK